MKYTKTSQQSTDPKISRPDESQDRSRARWTKTWAMLGALVMGIILAVGHHLFYRYLQGKDVNDILSQTWVTNIGTAFAFLFKMFLAIATGIAFIQHLWKTTKGHSYQVGEIDTMTGMLEDIFALLDARLWLQVPALVLIATITWLIPVAAVFPPGTLSVVFAATNAILNEQVSQLGFTNNTNWNTWEGTIATYGYNDASPYVYRATLASSTLGQVLSIPHEHVNASYSLQFYGPAIKCQNITDDLAQIWISHVNSSGSGGGMFYASVVGGDDHQLFNTSGLSCTEGSSCYRDAMDVESAFSGLDTNSTDAAKLYVMLGFSQTPFMCELYNASYGVSFNYTGVQQATTVDSLDLLNLVAANTSEVSDGGSQAFGKGSYISPQNLPYSEVIAYQSVMNAFGSLFVGALWGHYGGISSYQRYNTLVETLSIAPDWFAPLDSTAFQGEIEKLFQNVTLSMLNIPALQKDSNDTTNQPLSVTVTRYPAVYDYQPLRLWIAYGLSIGLTTLCLLIGLLAINSAGASYSNKFSTHIRATKNLHLHDLISDVDDGANPCPSDIRRAQVQIGEHERRMMGDREDDGFQLMDQR